MHTIRRYNPILDLAAVSAIDTSFSTDTIYDVVSSETGFLLRERLQYTEYTYPIEPLSLPEYAGAGFCIVSISEQTGAVSGMALVEIAEWNRRAALQHLYVDKPLRGGGAGTLLAEAAEAWARAAGFENLFVETQNINFPAIRFYRHRGYKLCGLDTTLYNGTGAGNGQTALFFSKPL